MSARGGWTRDDSDPDYLWITPEVRLPRELVRAHAEARLVLFVGAGASCDAPSNLPLFGGLARRLAELASVPFQDGVELDRFLGSMPRDFDVRRHTARLLTDPKSKPNSTHQALVRLASTNSVPRIVTTNFDDHLASASAESGACLPDSWVGPALPLGHNFAGLVHLHGSVRRHPDELVLTDDDFGRAYLTHAWATRFLLPMFAEYVVLFVGYSHDDPLMRYLALGLPSSSPRFVLATESSALEDKWQRLGLEVVSYPVQEGSHRALTAALEKWADRAEMGRLDHESRIASIVAAGPQMTPVDLDYLVGRLSIPEGARDFVVGVGGCGVDLEREWLGWLEALPAFRALFDQATDTPASQTLADWFCQLIQTPELTNDALGTVQRLGQTFSPRLFHGASWAASSLREHDHASSKRWQTLLATSIHGFGAPVPLGHMVGYGEDLPAGAWAVLRSALRPYVALKRRWLVAEHEGAQQPPDIEVQWATEAHELTRLVESALASSGSGDPTLGAVLEESLHAAYDLVEGYYDDGDRELFAWGRSAIEPHAQDSLRDAIDPLIDGLRDYGEAAISTKPDLIDRWWATGRRMFQRLALHLLTKDGTRSVDDRLEWLLERNLLFEYGLKHEVYQLLREITPSLSEPKRRALIAAVRVGPEIEPDVHDRERHMDYSIYNLLVWLVGADPTWAEANVALADVQARNPSFAPREHPDFDSWHSGGLRGDQMPMEPEEFIAQVQTDATAAVEGLAGRVYEDWSFDEPTWEDALLLLQRTAEQEPLAGCQAWDALKTASAAADRAAEMRHAIVQGWAKADLADSLPEALNRMASNIHDSAGLRASTAFLLSQIGRLVDSPESREVESMRSAAQRIWQTHADGFRFDHSNDPLSLAPLFLNSWPGDLAQFWTHEIDRRWRNNRAGWAGLNGHEQDALLSFLSAHEDARMATVPALTSTLYFLYAADADFARSHLFPLFTRPDTLAMAWRPFLLRPRCSDAMLADGLLEGVVGGWDVLPTIGADRQEVQFMGLVASILSFADVDDDLKRRLLDGSVLAENGRYAAAFAGQTVRLLARDDVDAENVWNRWVRAHVLRRIEGLPRTARPDELATWADCVPYLGRSVKDGLEVLGADPVPLGERSRFDGPPELLQSEDGPAVIAYLAARISISAPATTPGFRVRSLVQKVRAAVGEEATEPLIRAASGAGFNARGF